MGHVSVTISYSFHCLTTETKYFNENRCIENLAASKYTERVTNAIINNISYVLFACSEEVLPCDVKM